MPNDTLRDLEWAKIVVNNHHAFLLRETLPLSKGGRALLRGRGRSCTGANNLGSFGRWAFAELTDVYAMEEDFEGVLKAEFQALDDGVIS